MIVATPDEPIIFKNKEEGLKIWVKSINTLFKNYEKKDMFLIWTIFPDKRDKLKEAFLLAREKCGQDDFIFKSWDDFKKHCLVVFSPHESSKNIPKKTGSAKEKNYKIEHNKVLKSKIPKNWKQMNLDASFITSNFLVGVEETTTEIKIHYGVYPNKTDEKASSGQFMENSAGKKYDQSFKYIYLASREYLQKVRGRDQETNAHVLAEAKTDGWKFLTADEFIEYHNAENAVAA